MKITKITQQVKRSNRYSVFVDDSYSFSLSESALLASGIASGQELTPEQVEDYKRFSSDDKLYNQALRYVALRPRTTWEMRSYLERKEAAPSLADSILNKLSKIGLLDDTKFAESFVHDRRLLRPSSRRKITMELRKKRVPDSAIQAALGNERSDEQAALSEVITRKRRQTKYQDNLKLMQYLARQGFGYDDIKSALNQPDLD